MLIDEVSLGPYDLSGIDYASATEVLRLLCEKGDILANEAWIRILLTGTVSAGAITINAYPVSATEPALDPTTRPTTPARFMEADRTSSIPQISLTGTSPQESICRILFGDNPANGLPLALAIDVIDAKTTGILTINALSVRRRY